MIGPRKMEWYRRATPAEKFREYLELLGEVEKIMACLSPHERRRRWEAYRRDHEKGNRALMDLLGRAR
jgi:hypothetical protein